RPVRAWLDVPRLLERQLVILGQSEALAPFPRLAAIVGALDGCPVDGVVRSGEDRSVVRHRVEHVPPCEVRAFDCPVASGLVALEDEEPFPGADQNCRSHRSLAYATTWFG